VRFLLSYIICLFVVNLSFSQAGADDGSSVTSRICPVHTKAEALERASLFSGFHEKTATKSLSEDDVKLITLVDTTTPFLSKFTNCQKVWKVLYENVMLNKKPSKKNTSTNDYLNFEVFIDSATGDFVKAICRLKELDPNKDLEVSASIAEKQIGNNGYETYAVPDSPPKIDLATALLGCFTNPLATKEILAQYVLLKENGFPFKPMWIISFRGVPPSGRITFGAPPSLHRDTSKPLYEWPDYTKSRVREGISAITGKIRFSSSYPTAPLSPEDRYILKHGKPKEQKKK